MPPAPQLGTTLALYAPALPGASQLATHPQLAPHLTEAAAVQPARPVGVPFAACTQTAMPVDAQPEMFAAYWDKEDANALIKLSSRARFSNLAGNNIREFVADFELYLRICMRLVHHWGYFLMASLGAEEAEKLRRSHLADTIADY